MAVIMEFKTEGEANMVRAILNNEAATKKLERATQMANRQTREQHSAFSSLAKTMTSVAGGFLGAAGINRAISASVEEFKKGIAATRQFETEMTGLLSLGDNLGNIDALKSKVLDLSGALGLSSKMIADTLFAIQSNASSLDSEIQGGIFQTSVGLTKLFGTELPVSTTAMTKAMLIYGDQLTGVNEAQAKLAITADRGALTFADLAELFPQLASAAKGFGTSYDELLSTIIVATQLGGRNEKTFTDLRNIILKMGEAMNQGIASGAGLANQLESLANVDPEKMKEIFGQRTVSMALALAENAGRIRTEMEGIAAVSDNLVSEKLAQRLQDSSYLMSEILSKFEELQKAQDIQAAGKGPTLFERFQAAKTESRKDLPEIFKWWANVDAAISAVTPGMNVFEKGGATTAIRKQMQAGQFEEASAMASRFGLDIGKIGVSTYGRAGWTAKTKEWAGGPVTPADIIAAGTARGAPSMGVGFPSMAEKFPGWIEAQEKNRTDTQDKQRASALDRMQGRADWLSLRRETLSANYHGVGKDPRVVQIKKEEQLLKIKIDAAKLEEQAAKRKAAREGRSNMNQQFATNYDAGID